MNGPVWSILLLVYIDRDNLQEWLLRRPLARNRKLNDHITGSKGAYWNIIIYRKIKSDIRNVQNWLLVIFWFFFSRRSWDAYQTFKRKSCRKTWKLFKSAYYWCSIARIGNFLLNTRIGNFHLTQDPRYWGQLRTNKRTLSIIDRRNPAPSLRKCLARIDNITDWAKIRLWRDFYSYRTTFNCTLFHHGHELQFLIFDFDRL